MVGRPEREGGGVAPVSRNGEWGASPSTDGKVDRGDVAKDEIGSVGGFEKVGESWVFGRGGNVGVMFKEEGNSILIFRIYLKKE